MKYPKILCFDLTGLNIIWNEDLLLFVLMWTTIFPALLSGESPPCWFIILHRSYTIVSYMWICFYVLYSVPLFIYSCINITLFNCNRSPMTISLRKGLHSLFSVFLNSISSFLFSFYLLYLFSSSYLFYFKKNCLLWIRISLSITWRPILIHHVVFYLFFLFF